MVKRLDSVYEPGTRSSAWREIKILRRQEFVVGGWLEGQRSLEKQLGSLMVGVWDDGRLVMAGRVGSGLTEVERARLERLLVALTDQPPFAEVPPLDKRSVWSSQPWWSRSNTANGPPAASSGIPSTEACGSTGIRRRSPGSREARSVADGCLDGAAEAVVSPLRPQTTFAQRSSPPDQREKLP